MMLSTLMMLNNYFGIVKSEKGQGLAEYALIIVLIAIAVVGALTTVGTNISEVFGDIGAELTETGGGL